VIMIDAPSGAHSVAAHHGRTCAAIVHGLRSNRGTHRTPQHAVDGDGVRNTPTSDMRHDLCPDLCTVRHSRSADPAHVRPRLVLRDLPRIGPALAPRRRPENGHLAHPFAHTRARRKHGMGRSETTRLGAARRQTDHLGLQNEFTFERLPAMARLRRESPPMLQRAASRITRLRPTPLCPLLTRPSRTLRAATRCPDGPP
jgi:hypothetical protein